ncbi:hypothetical protein ACQPZJ_17020 [Actinoplanes sp. CA-054009]
MTSATGTGRISGAARADFAAAAAAVLMAANDRSQVYELGGPPFSLDELAGSVTAATGTPVVHRNLDQDDFIADRRAAGQAAAAFVAAVDSSIAAGQMQTDSTVLAQLIGRTPITLIESARRSA